MSCDTPSILVVKVSLTSSLSATEHERSLKLNSEFFNSTERMEQ